MVMSNKNVKKSSTILKSKAFKERYIKTSTFKNFKEIFI